MIEFVGFELRPIPGDPLYCETVRAIPVLCDGVLCDTIAARFRTDKTSWPRGLRWVPWLTRKWIGNERYDPAAVYHDWMLEHTTRPKWECDLRYKYALRSTRVSALETWLFGSTVRLKRSRK